MKIDKEYQRIYQLVKASKMFKRDADAFYAAYRTALRESNFGRFSLGCALVIGNRVISVGANTTKTDPMQKEYNNRYRQFNEGLYSNNEHSIHAEIAAIKAVSYPVAANTNWSKVKAYVYRIAPGLPYEQGIAIPCGACAHALADMGVKEVYFSTEYGFGKLHLNSKVFERIEERHQCSHCA